MRSFSSLLNRFRRDRRGNIAVIFGIACIPLISAIGCAVDYSEATRIKAKLQSAADAAAVASISQQSQGWLTASTMTGSGEVTTAEQNAMNIFNGNISTVPTALYSLNTVLTKAVVMKTGSALTATVNFNATVPVTFMKVWGWSNLTVSGSSSANASLPLYLDFYLMLDVSGSMGLPSTTSPNGGEAGRMQSISPDNFVQYPTGCTLACHFAQVPLNQLYTAACIDPSPNTPPPPRGQSVTVTQKYPTGNYCLGYDISRVSQSAYAQLLANHSGQLPAYKYTSINSPQVAQPTAFYSTSTAFPNDPVLTPVTSCPTPGTDACIQLRLDAVGYAVNQLLITANSSAVISQQFRVGLYPYITSLYQNYSTLTNALNGNPNTPGTINYAAANLATLLDNNSNSSLGSGGTNQDAALSTMNHNVITSVGNGSAPTNTLPYLFIITDGAVTPQTKGVPNGNWGGSNQDTVIATPDTNCTAIKNRGITISILYIPFQPINPVNTSFASNEDTAANNNIPHIPGSLQSCATNGFFYTANTPTDITNALQAMFNHALVTAHITN
jgi:Flp pilus assembly protein TadG